MQDNPNQNNAEMALPERLINEESLDSLKDLYGSLGTEVELHLYEAENAEDIFTRFNRQLCEELTGASGKIRVVRHGAGEAPADFPFTERPAIAIQGKDAKAPVLHMLGAPLGEEGKVLVQAVLLAGSGKSGLSQGAKDVLARLGEKREVLVFGTGSCPYCPGQMVLAANLAAERPDLIRSYAIAADQFPDLSQSFGVGGVPHTVVNREYMVVGLMPDEPFSRFISSFNKADLGQYAQSLIRAPKGADSAAAGQSPDTHADSDASSGSGGAGRGAVPPALAAAFGGKKEVAAYGVVEEKGDEFNPDLLILGGGPAGLTAAMYGARAGLKVTLLDSGILGGQVATTPVVENYPGFKTISGQALMENMVFQSASYAHLKQGLEITNLESKDGYFVAHTSNGQYKGRALVIATGAAHKHLNIPGEALLSGRGVHYCASCDGYMYSGKKVIVNGGGNTALTDALHLKNLNADVTIVHRRDQFRAEQALANAVKKAGINVVWHGKLKEITGTDKVEAVIVEDARDGKEQRLEADAVFISIGKNPNSRPARAVGADLNQDMTIKVDAKMRTTVPLVYAAGDVNGGFQQIVAAVASGAVAANTAFEDLQKD